MDAKACPGGTLATTFATTEADSAHARPAASASMASREHLEQVEQGCPLVALGSETARQAPEVRQVTTRHLKAMVDLVARQSPEWGQPGAHERALVTVATMVGTLLLARAVDEPALSDSLCAAALKHLPIA
jgi:TetR/AcrR family transcriptional repressor of nem operon